MAQKKPNWNFAPPDAEAGCAEGVQNFAAWYKRDGKGAVWQICEAAGARKWTWMGGRVDFPIPFELRPDAFPLNKSHAVSSADLVFAALVDCVSVMEKDLNGLALIQPELKQAKQAIDAYQVVDADFFEWDGEGFPPAGTVCELRKKDGGWGHGTIKYMSNTMCVWLWDNGNPDQREWACEPSAMEFRTKGSGEKIKAEEAEKEIQSMAVDLRKYFANPVTSARCLHQAGYRKVAQ